MTGRSRPLQNRITPFGDIVAHPAYGAFMGNRGCLHDAKGRNMATSDGDRWIICEPRWPGIRRELIAPGKYAELFFRDEATALAAGHRPCGQCRKQRLDAFKSAWMLAYGLGAVASAPVMDAALRSTPALNDRPELAASDIPDGAMATLSGSADAWLRWRGRWHHWSFNGYGDAGPPPAAYLLPLTPAPIIATIAAGYVPHVAIG